PFHVSQPGGGFHLRLAMVCARSAVLVSMDPLRGELAACALAGARGAAIVRECLVHKQLAHPLARLRWVGNAVLLPPQIAATATLQPLGRGLRLLDLSHCGRLDRLDSTDRLPLAELDDCAWFVRGMCAAH